MNSIDPYVLKRQQRQQQQQKQKQQRKSTLQQTRGGRVKPENVCSLLSLFDGSDVDNHQGDNACSNIRKRRDRSDNNCHEQYQSNRTSALYAQQQQQERQQQQLPKSSRGRPRKNSAFLPSFVESSQEAVRKPAAISYPPNSKRSCRSRKKYAISSSSRCIKVKKEDPPEESAAGVVGELSLDHHAAEPQKRRRRCRPRKIIRIMDDDEKCNVASNEMKKNTNNNSNNKPRKTGAASSTKNNRKAFETIASRQRNRSRKNNADDGDSSSSYSWKDSASSSSSSSSDSRCSSSSSSWEKSTNSRGEKGKKRKKERRRRRRRVTVDLTGFTTSESSSNNSDSSINSISSRGSKNAGHQQRGKKESIDQLPLQKQRQQQQLASNNIDIECCNEVENSYDGISSKRTILLSRLEEEAQEEFAYETAQWRDEDAFRGGRLHSKDAKNRPRNEDEDDESDDDQDVQFLHTVTNTALGDQDKNFEEESHERRKFDEYFLNCKTSGILKDPTDNYKISRQRDPEGRIYAEARTTSERLLTVVRETKSKDTRRVIDLSSDLPETTVQQRKNSPAARATAQKEKESPKETAFSSSVNELHSSSRIFVTPEVGQQKQKARQNNSQRPNPFEAQGLPTKHSIILETELQETKNDTIASVTQNKKTSATTESTMDLSNRSHSQRKIQNPSSSTWNSWQPTERPAVDTSPLSPAAAATSKADALQAVTAPKMIPLSCIRKKKSKNEKGASSLKEVSPAIAAVRNKTHVLSREESKLQQQKQVATHDFLSTAPSTDRKKLAQASSFLEQRRIDHFEEKYDCYELSPPRDEVELSISPTVTKGMSNCEGIHDKESIWTAADLQSPPSLNEMSESFGEKCPKRAIRALEGRQQRDLLAERNVNLLSTKEKVSVAAKKIVVPTAMRKNRRELVLRGEIIHQSLSEAVDGDDDDDGEYMMRKSTSKNSHLDDVKLRSLIVEDNGLDGDNSNFEDSGEEEEEVDRSVKPHSVPAIEKKDKGKVPSCLRPKKKEYINPRLSNVITVNLGDGDKRNQKMKLPCHEELGDGTKDDASVEVIDCSADSRAEIAAAGNSFPPLLKTAKLYVDKTECTSSLPTLRDENLRILGAGFASKGEEKIKEARTVEKGDHGQMLASISKQILDMKSFQQCFYDDNTGRSPMRKRTIKFVVKAMKLQAKRSLRLLKGCDKQVIARSNRLLQTIIWETQKRLRAVNKLPLVYIQSNDNSFSSEDLQQINEEERLHVRQLQLSKAKLERQFQRMQAELEQVERKGDELQRTLELEREAEAKEINPLLLDSLDKMYDSRKSKHGSRMYYSVTPAVSSGSPRPAVTLCPISSVVEADKKLFYRPAKKQTVKNLVKNMVAKSRQMFGDHHD